MTARAFFRTPKGQLLVVLGILLAVAMAVTGTALTIPGVVAAAITAIALDAPILRRREGKWKFPSGALLTAMIVAMVLAPHEPWYVAAVATALAIASKYVARTKTANVFNPAALALLGVFFIFGAEESWWGAFSDAPAWLTAIMIGGGVYIAVHLKKLPGILAFLGVYFAAFTLASFVSDPAKVWEVFRAPDLQAVLYLALFMVTDPPTSPPKPTEQAQFGALAAVVTVVTYFTGGGAYFLLTGVLAANVWEAARRTRWRARRASPNIVH